ncbi:thiol:disulfide interchange protein [Couchioplanes caeruleus subsp. caeruleus]|uniref:Thiol:disulfide interchange protein n=1 Tax=Couchioplanes caeruleus subsp. caeruleus TaxID=56427 RepID=A0A1K0GW90_9ACTN|nr:thiol:disulfide interchange protein [Couchioplanes caeruleus subsp. caeruleus]
MWLVPSVALLLAACTTSVGTPDPERPSPFADCAILAAASSSPPGSSDLPDVSLPCFTGGAQVRISDLRGPAVINLWGSWCGPCRQELPLMQELADATSGRLRVLGVDTRDDRDAGASFAADHGVTMPTLFDRDQELLSALGRASLPVTVFLDAQGKQFVYTGKALDKLTLGTLVRTHTGVTVTG